MAITWNVMSQRGDGNYLQLIKSQRGEQHLFRTSHHRGGIALSCNDTLQRGDGTYLECHKGGGMVALTWNVTSQKCPPLLSVLSVSNAVDFN